MCIPKESLMLLVMQSVQRRDKIQASGFSVFSVAFSLLVILLVAMEDINHTETKGVPSFAQGLQILLIDHDSTSLMHMASLLKKYSFKVTTTALASVALSMIREQQNHYQLVMANINMPDTDRDSFLSLVHKEDIPVILMSSKMNINVARKALAEGACFFLEKPVSVEDLKNIWQHAYRKTRNPSMATAKHEGSCEKNMNSRKGFQGIKINEAGGICSPSLLGTKRKEFGGVCRPASEHDLYIDTQKTWTSSAYKSAKVPIGDGYHNREVKCSCNEKLITTESQEKRPPGTKRPIDDMQEQEQAKKMKTNLDTVSETTEKNEEGMKIKDSNGIFNNKKSRAVWTPELHLKFTAALSALGDKNARPKLIHQVMNATDVTVRQVASHLQKYKNQVNRMLETDKTRPSISKPSIFNIRNEFPPAKLSYLVSQYEKRMSRLGVQGNITRLNTPNSLMRPHLSSVSFNNHDDKRQNLYSGHTVIPRFTSHHTNYPNKLSLGNHAQFQNLNLMREKSRFSYGVEMNNILKKYQPLGLSEMDLPSVNYMNSEFASSNIPTSTIFQLPSEPPAMNEDKFYTPAPPAWNAPFNSQNLNQFSTDFSGPTEVLDFMTEQTFFGYATNPEKLPAGFNDTTAREASVDLLKLLEEKPIESNGFGPATNAGEANLLKLLEENRMDSNCFGQATNAGQADRLKLLEENPMDSNCFGPAINAGEADPLKLHEKDHPMESCFGIKTNAGSVDHYCEWLTDTLF